MAKLRSTSRTRSPPLRRRETTSKTRLMEETTIGKAYASPFLALLARINGELTHIKVTPLHGFFMPSYQLEKKDTIISPLRAIGNYFSPNSTTKSVKKQFTATRGRIAPIPVSVTSDKSKGNLADIKYCSPLGRIENYLSPSKPAAKGPFLATRGRIAPTLVNSDRLMETLANTKYCSPLETIGTYLSTTESVNKPFNATRGRISPTPANDDTLKENSAAASKPTQSSGSGSQQKIKEANLEFEKQTRATIKFAKKASLNAVTHGLLPSACGGQIGDTLETFGPVEMRDTIETAFTAKAKEIGEVDFGEILRAFWMEDAVFHRRLTTAAFVVVLLMMFGKWLFVV